ncbi:CD276 antigen isoform X2 [Latimeria chalumnae]|uniref:CD276 antigen isoform X2 n=1 Tax=Latimeria chalumnae TaxID=7897 RepID=UPI0003C1216B|nr:PREDICTED: CD276 antigen-like isoform X2 [Latimeria chalumnae]|eukprot:XP_006004955.1 PREDICTED: CD276 antigen-like isoform X2 [Latimeria chalumnae]
MWLQYPQPFNLLFLLFATLNTAYNLVVTTTHSTLVARVGENVTLDCSFSPKTYSGLMIQWNLLSPSPKSAYNFFENHSSLEYQDDQYKSRTQVNESMFFEGNATLILRDIGIMDEGTYQCYIRTTGDYGEVTLELKVAAPYTEPEVTCQADCTIYHTDRQINLVCTSEGGYPEAEVEWTFLNGTPIITPDQSNHTRDGQGLFQMKSTIQLEEDVSHSILCVLKNPLINQNTNVRTTCSRMDYPGKLEMKRKRDGLIASLVVFIFTTLTILALLQWC